MKLGVQIVLTLVVGLALGSLVWTHAPDPWGPMSIAGLALMAIGFVLWTVARSALGTRQRDQTTASSIYSSGRIRT